MLSKSMKHEFRATSRVMLPLFAALLLMSVVAHFAIQLLTGTNNLHWLLETISAIVIALFAISVVAVAVGVLILTVSRFYRSFLSDEGYLNMTLPVSVHTHIFSRLIVAVIWYALTVIAVLLACLIMGLNLHEWKEFFVAIGDVLRGLSEQHLTGRAILLGLETLLAMVMGCSFSSLLLYAAMAVGHSFNRHKKGMSVLFAFVFYYAIQIIGVVGIAVLTHMDWDNWFDITAENVTHALNVFQALLGGVIGVNLIGCALFYFITHFFLSKKLNLE